MVLTWLDLRKREYRKGAEPSGQTMHMQRFLEKMNIGLIDVDGHNFPNLPLMNVGNHQQGRTAVAVQSVVDSAQTHGAHGCQTTPNSNRRLPLISAMDLL